MFSGVVVQFLVRLLSSGGVVVQFLVGLLSSF